MRIHSTDDEGSGIMDLSQLLDRADDLSFNVHTGDFDMATKKAAAPAPAAAPTAPAKKTKAAAAPAPAAAAPAAEKTGGPRAVPEGHVGLADVASSLGISPAAARRKLRASETSFKGENGYAWKKDSAEHKAVVKHLTPAPAPAA